MVSGTEYRILPELRRVAVTTCPRLSLLRTLFCSCLRRGAQQTFSTDPRTRRVASQTLPCIVRAYRLD